MTQQTFANFIGMSPASLSNIFNDRTKPTLNTVEAIKGKIPHLNIEWLMFGHGSMFDDEKEAASDVATGGSVSGEEPSLAFMDDTPNLFNHPAEHSVRPERTRQPAPVTKTEVKYVERPQRQITEIRVYFDDLTYETFVPKK